jgi:hypothetical protein
MTFIEIYDRVINVWGDKIEFSDGLILEGENESFEKSTEGFQSDSLTKLWNKTEELVGTSDSYKELMVWTMYQVFHRNAKRVFRQNIHTLIPMDISKTEIEKQYFDNLNELGWEEELSNYERRLD